MIKRLKFIYAFALFVIFIWYAPIYWVFTGKKLDEELGLYEN